MVSEVTQLHGEQLSWLSGRYEIVAELGDGDLGVTYLVSDHKERANLRSLEVRLALKLFHPTFSQAGEFRARIGRFVSRLEPLRHANVLRLFDLIEVDGGLALSMEFVDGSSVSELRQAVRYAPGQVVHLLRGAACGLGALHDTGVIHGKVAPSNVLVRHDGAVKIHPLGALDVPGSGAQMTSHGAPELASGRPLTRQCDVYGLAAVGFELLCGVPFSRDELWRLDDSHPVFGLRRYLAVARRAPTLSSYLKRCLSEDPAARPQDMQDFLKGLDSLSGIEERSLGTVTRPALTKASPVPSSDVSQIPAWSFFLFLSTAMVLFLTALAAFGPFLCTAFTP